jgi:hypothetical protein
MIKRVAEADRSPDPVSEAFRRVLQGAQARHNAAIPPAAREQLRPRWIDGLIAAIARVVTPFSRR